MDSYISAKYSIRRFTSSKDKDFAYALMLYSDVVPADTKTSSNEIMYFVDHSSSQTKRIMYFFGLYVDERLIGFVEAGYLTTTKTIIIDYIVLKEGYRLNSVFYPLFSLVQRYFSENMIDYDYIATEVSTKCPEQSVDAESFFSKKMLQMEDFRVADVLYRQPKLGLDNYESNFDFQLMIKSTQAISSLKKETYLAIVHDIFFEHYYPWYEVADSARKDEYRAHLESEYALIERSANKVDEGVALQTHGVSCAYYKAPDCHFTNSTAGFAPRVKPKLPSKLLFAIGIPCVTVCAFALSIIVYYSLGSIGIPAEKFAELFAGISAICTGLLTLAFSYFSKSKR